MVIVNDCEKLPAKFPTVTIKVMVPRVVGVPLITPAELSEKPLGQHQATDAGADLQLYSPHLGSR